MIFAANHASHIDTPLLLTTLPVGFRHRTVVAAASDYFFDRTWKSVLWSFALAAIPIERQQGQPPVGRHRRRAGRGRLEPGHLPRGRALARRLDAALHAAGPPTWPGGPVVRSCRCTCTAPATWLPKTAEAGARAPGGSGTESRRRGRVRRSPIAVLFGAPLSPDEGENAHRFSDRVEAAVATLAREVHSDWWQARRSVSGVAPVEGAETAHRGPAASAWRRAWALDEPPSRRRRLRVARLTLP